MLDVIQHVPFEGPGAVTEWAWQRGLNLRILRADLGESLASAADSPLLVVMGGPMSVLDVEQFPWIEDELNLLRERIATDRPTLGICLGAQLIARAAGSQIRSASEKEIGWYPVQRCTSAGLGRLLPKQFAPLHWHGETFDLPKSATLLASSECCPNQAFQLGQHILGLQFHLEATRESAAALISGAGHEITSGPYQTPAEQIIRELPPAETVLHPILFDLLDAIAKSALV
jgi:GMP synthase-like glutamine amidotransferase